MRFDLISGEKKKPKKKTKTKESTYKLRKTIILSIDTISNFKSNKI